MASAAETAKTPPAQPFPANFPPYTGGFHPPPFYTYAPPAPPDGNGENAAHHAPYMMPYPPPPGMVYAYPPPSQGFYQGEANGKQTKRRQVKMACTNCAAACKRCDEARPCERCVKYGLSEQCQDGTRKERKKGIKRGPYKRKNKTGSTSTSTSDPAPQFGSFIPHPLPPAIHPSGDASVVEWHPHPPPPPTSGTSTDAAASGGSSSAGASSSTSAVQAMPQYAPPPGPEGYYPYYYPPLPPGFIPHPPGPGQEGSDGTVPPGAMVQFFPLPPGAYPFPHYAPYPPPPHPAQQPQPPQQSPQHQQTMDPKQAQIAHRQEESEEEPEEEEESSPIVAPSSHPDPPGRMNLVAVSEADIKADSTSVPPAKKRGRVAKSVANGEPKAKKVRSGKKTKRTNET